jgi:hypothetical protein
LLLARVCSGFDYFLFLWLCLAVFLTRAIFSYEGIQVLPKQLTKFRNIKVFKKKSYKKG